MRDMSKAAQPVPAGFHTLTVHLTESGCADYTDFLKQTFSAVEIDSLMTLNHVFPEFGHPATSIEDLTPDEMQQRAAAAFSGGQA